MSTIGRGQAKKLPGNYDVLYNNPTIKLEYVRPTVNGWEAKFIVKPEYTFNFQQ
jgi:hypothetical protein